MFKRVYLIIEFYYNSKQCRLLLFFFIFRAALVAVSKTSLTPSLFLAEHSRYATAFICFVMV